MRGFSSSQLKRLNRPIDAAEIYYRKRGGKEFTHVTGWYAISEANAIFGHAGWDRETIVLEKVFERARSEMVSCGYMARVRVTVHTTEGAVCREGTGFGHASAPAPSDAYEYALKAAETDATKRALATFGARGSVWSFTAKSLRVPLLWTAKIPYQIAAFLRLTAAS